MAGVLRRLFAGQTPAWDVAGDGSQGYLRALGLAAGGMATPVLATPTNGTGSIIWTWGAVAGALTYDLQYSADGGSSWNNLALGLAALTYTDLAAQAHCNANGVVFVRIRANGISLSSPYSAGTAGTEYITAWGINVWNNLEDLTAAIGDGIGGVGNLTNNNGVTFTAGKIGNAATMSAGSNQFLSRASGAGYQAGNVKVWFAVWVKATAYPAHVMGIVSKDATGAREYSLVYSNTSNAFILNLGNGAANIVGVVATNFGAPSPGVYYFLFGYFDPATQKLSLSVNNGTPNLSGASPSPPTVSTSQFEVGRRNIDGPGFCWDGQIDSLAKGIMTDISMASDIARVLYNAGAGRAAPFNGN